MAFAAAWKGAIRIAMSTGNKIYRVTIPYSFRSILNHENTDFGELDLVTPKALLHAIILDASLGTQIMSRMLSTLPPEITWTIS